tara:strand:+ start:1594 stop:2547 length:954 start_codon:yes stop_codon:yes gene_type:complete
MAPLRSLGNILSSFNDFYATTAAAASSSGGGGGAFNASGGNQTSATGFTNGSYTYHIFTSSGALTVSGGGSKEIQFLVVAGGGGGGYGNGGAGGAGGVRTNDPGTPSPTGMEITSTVSLNPGPHTITVGDGGGSHDAPYANRVGGNSSIGSLVVASGGGAGGPMPASDNPNMNGGSGGGQQGPVGSSVASPDPLSPNKQGHDGATENGGGGGGGGGGAASSQTGGAKIICPAFSSPIINPGCPMPTGWQAYVGPTGTYAGGGYGYPGRGSSFNAPNLSGYGLDDYAGVVNTGGGADSNNEGPTRKGGKGIVIIRYLT